MNKSDSEYFPSSDSSDNELSTSCSPEPSKSETSDDDIFPSIPKIYPRTYQRRKIILVKKKNDPRINLNFDNEDDMIENQLENITADDDNEDNMIENQLENSTADEIRAMFESIFSSDEDI